MNLLLPVFSFAAYPQSDSGHVQNILAVGLAEQENEIQMKCISSVVQRKAALADKSQGQAILRLLKEYRMTPAEVSDLTEKHP